MRFLRRNTAIDIIVGFLIDYADGKSLLIDDGSFDPTQLTCSLVKGVSRESLTLTRTGGQNNMTLIADGNALFSLSASNTNQAGHLRLGFSNAVVGGELILPFLEDFIVLREDIYDTYFRNTYNYRF